MRIYTTAALVITAISLGACASDEFGGPLDNGEFEKRYGNHDRGERYDRRGDRRDHRHRRYLDSNDRIYRAKNGHYYCKRSDSTAGALVGLTGDVLGNEIARGKSKKLGKILEDSDSALARRVVARGRIRCE